MPRPRSSGRKSTDAGQVLVRLNAEEYAAIVKAADGLPLGMWARTTLLHAAEAKAMGRHVSIEAHPFARAMTKKSRTP